MIQDVLPALHYLHTRRLHPNEDVDSLLGILAEEAIDAIETLGDCGISRMRLRHIKAVLELTQRQV